MKPKLKFNIGDKFGRLTIIKESPPNKSNQRMVLCRCDCGKESDRNLRQLLLGAVPRFCSCLIKKTKGQIDHDSYFKKKAKREIKGIKNLPNEEWKDVVGYEGRYVVSNMGRVKGIKRNSINKGVNHEWPEKLLSPSGKKYKTACLYKNGKRNYLLVHRLVALAFIPNPENKPEVNHKRGYKIGHSVENLEWSTKSENQIHAYENGFVVAPKGEKHYGCKLSDLDVINIRNSYNKKNMNGRELSQIYNVSRPTIYNIINYKRRLSNETH